MTRRPAMVRLARTVFDGSQPLVFGLSWILAAVIVVGGMGRSR
jgi:hypothetical protein